MTICNIGQGSLDDCTACTGGMYCEGEGSITPDGQCDEGYYCISNSNSRTPSYNGTVVTSRYVL